MLTEVTLPGTLKIISDEMFRNCSWLKTITLPEKLTEIRSDAFNGCMRLSKFILPESIRLIVEGAFAGCESIESFLYAGNPAKWATVEKQPGWKPADIPEFCLKEDDAKTPEASESESVLTVYSSIIYSLLKRTY